MDPDAFGKRKIQHCCRCGTLDVSIFGYFTYAPILRGFFVLLVAGALFPLTGVFVLRLNLITLRFMLMHGTLLGGAIALGFGLNPLLIGIVLNVLLVLVVSQLSLISGRNAGHITTFFMVLTIGLAFIVIYKMQVPAKDALSILWGNLYAMSGSDVLFTMLFCFLSLLFVLILYRRLKAVIFSREIAFSSGVRDKLIYNAILVLTGLTIAFAMRLIGALLLDALLLLPAIVASFFAKSTKGVFLIAGVLGFVSSLSGFFVSLALDIPASSAVTVVAAVILGAGVIIKKRRKIKQ